MDSSLKRRKPRLGGFDTLCRSKNHLFRFRLILHLLQLRFGFFYAGLRLGNQIAGDKRPAVREVNFQRKSDRLNVKIRFAEQHRHRGLQWNAGIRITFVTANKAIGGPRVVRIVDARHSILQDVGLTRHAIGSHVMRFKKGAEPIVIGLRNRIVFVRMTASAFEGQSQESGRGVLHDVAEPDIPVEEIPIAGEIACGTHHRGIVRRQFIAGNHLHNHPVVRLVLVQRFHGPVAPTPDMPLRIADLVALTVSVPVRISPDVEPVTAPALAIAGALQQLADNLIVGLRIVAYGECGDLLRCWRQSGKVHVDAPQERGLIGLWQRGQAAFGTVVLQKRIDWVSSGVSSRDGGPYRIPECPVLSDFGEIHTVRIRHGLPVIGAGLDPFGDARDIGVRQLLAFEGHGRFGDVRYRFVKLRVIGLADSHYWSVFAAAKHGLAGGQIQTALLCSGVMAAKTGLLEEGVNVVPIQVWSLIRILRHEVATRHGNRHGKRQCPHRTSKLIVNGNIWAEALLSI